MSANAKENGRVPPIAAESTPAMASPYDRLVAHWPGPAARLAQNGAVLGANAAAKAMLSEFSARTGDLSALAAEISGGGASRLDTVVVPGAAAPVTLDVSLVPAGDTVLILARDVSLAANMRNALADSRKRYKDIVEISSDFAWETDADGAFAFVSPQGALGWRADDLLGRKPTVFAHMEGDNSVAEPFLTQVPIEQTELWLRRADGSDACVQISALPLFAPDGRWKGARGLARDVTEAREREAELAEARNRERLIAHVVRAVRDEVEAKALLTAAATETARALGAGCAIWRVVDDMDGISQFVSGAQFGGKFPEDMDIERRFAAKLRLDRPDTEGADALVELRSKGGRALVAPTAFRRRINGLVALFRDPFADDWTEGERDVLAEIAAQLGIAHAQLDHIEALDRQASTDALTGLLNRRRFVSELEARIAACKRSGTQGALIYVDLDNFKAVNDILGHQAGDTALKQVARTLRKATRINDLVARLGGDEFALWLDQTDLDGAIAKAKHILDMRGELLGVSASPEKPLGFSAGVALHDPAKPETVDELLVRGDGAMYEVKRKGKGTYAVALDAAPALPPKN
ncbi:MAG: diguanylate cyclase [Alphaproteobacteria bacterium]|nr:diguanylate cyclase [Alphaproteobacteria bacterium]